MAANKSFRRIQVKIGTVNAKSAEQEVIGRDGLVDSFWRETKQSSLRVLAERRMGKTWVLHLAISRRPEWAVPLFLDTEGLSSAPEFVLKLGERLYQSDLIPTKWYEKTWKWVRRVGHQLQGQTVGKWKVPSLESWKSLFEDTCQQFAQKSGGRHPVLIVDELPLLLDKIIKDGRPQEAIDLLDHFRYLRQEIPSLRMVFCGSLGLHIVLGKLKDQEYTGQPVNDMPPFEVPPLAADDAFYLSGCLLLGQEMGCSDIEVVARAVAEASCGVPFYIQHVVSWMSQHKQVWTPETVAGVPRALFEAPEDPAEFSYYDERLSQYYPADIVDKARAALDVLSQNASGVDFDTLLNLVRHRPKTKTIDPEQLLGVLDILQKDHYILQENRCWRFKLAIVRDSWHSRRGSLAL